MTTELATVLHLRPASPRDRGYIASTWLKSYRSSPIAWSLGGAAYSYGWSKVIDGYLDTCTTICAALNDDPNVVGGFLVYSPPQGEVGWRVHFCCVADVWRRKGCARWLLDEAKVPDEGVGYTHTAPHDIPIPKGWGYVPEAHRACTSWLKGLADAVQDAGQPEGGAVIRGLAASVDRMAQRVRRVG